MTRELARWRERNLVVRELREQTARHLREIHDESAAPYLFAGDEKDQYKAYKSGTERLRKFVEFVTVNHKQARRLRDLVARSPLDGGRWAEFLKHESERSTTTWKGDWLKPLEASLCSEQVGEWILDSVLRDGSDRSGVTALKWKRMVFLSLVDAIIDRAVAEKGD